MDTRTGTEITTDTELPRHTPAARTAGVAGFFECTVDSSANGGSALSRAGHFPLSISRLTEDPAEKYSTASFRLFLPDLFKFIVSSG